MYTTNLIPDDIGNANVFIQFNSIELDWIELNVFIVCR